MLCVVCCVLCAVCVLCVCAFTTVGLGFVVLGGTRQELLAFGN